MIVDFSNLFNLVEGRCVWILLTSQIILKSKSCTGFKTCFGCYRLRECYYFKAKVSKSLLNLLFRKQFTYQDSRSLVFIFTFHNVLRWLMILSEKMKVDRKCIYLGKSCLMSENFKGQNAAKKE